MKKRLKYFAFAIIFPAIIFAGLKLYTHNFIRQKTALTNTKSFEQPDTTEVFVLGTLHKTTKKVDYNDLYNLLETIKPNIILYEADSLNFDKKMNKKNRWWKVKFPYFLDKYQQSNLEEIAVRKYLYHNKNVIIRPYEWGQRDVFHKKNQILTMPNLIFQRLEELNTSNKLTSNQKMVLENYYSLHNQLEKFGDSTLYEINTPYQDSIAKERQDAHYHKLKTIIDSNENLKEFREFYKVNEAYWDIRNKAMANNIKVIIKRFPKSRIVVLNGYYHRYYLRQELIGKQGELGFKLLDITK